jgi:gamma-glutamyltranspeptidase / glutathione hydrolase
VHGRRPTVASLHGIVAAAHPLAAQAGARLLGQGGNAFDAAAATAAALNVVEPYMSGLAGMGLATCYIAAERRIRCLDFVSRVPERFPVERLNNREQVFRGALPVGAPGNFAGWCELVRAYGRKPIGEALQPAIAIVRDGYPLIEFNVEETNLTAPEIKRESALYDTWSRNYTGGAGNVAPGFVLRQPELARTLEQLAAEGPDLLYRGALGRAIVAHLEALGGTLTRGDLEAVKPVWKDPLAARYRDLLVHTLPPPCEGFQFLLTLRILDGIDLKRLERDGVEHVDAVWRAIRLAAGVRIASNNPPPDKLAALLADDHVAALRQKLQSSAPLEGPAEQWLVPAPPVGVEHHTTSFSIADRDGNVVCVTQSLGSAFGSGVVVPGTGVTLNNFLYWADVNPASPNRVKPGSALPMCMAPTVSTRDGKPALALGTPGSYGILQTQAQALIQHVDFGLPLQLAIEAPRGRLFDGRQVHAEARFAPAVLDALRLRGHELDVGQAWTMKVGGIQGIAIDAATGVLTGACDPRRDGYIATGN